MCWIAPKELHFLGFVGGRKHNSYKAEDFRQDD
jgi:hypothetical protein